MSSSFYNADKRAYKRTMLVGFLLCAAFVAVCFFARPQDNDYVLVKADKLVRTAGKPMPAN
jgi:fucose permease